MSDIKIGKMILSSFGTNCYFVYREGKEDVIFFDPGDQGGYIYDKLSEHGLKVKAILLTHGHFDHIAGVKELKEKSGAKVYALDAEADFLMDIDKNLTSQFGRPITITPDVLLKDGEELTLFDIDIKVIATPGHTEGGASYYIKEAGFLISGDTLFEGSVGRTDFPTGSMSVLVRSIKEKLFTLPDDTKVYPGHGEMTTIGDEKKYNPFVQ